MEKKSIKQQAHNAWPNSSGYTRMPQEIVRMREKYGTVQQFLATFPPAMQTVAAREWVRAYTGTAPTLGVVVAGYGEPVAIV